MPEEGGQEPPSEPSKEVLTANLSSKIAVASFNFPTQKATPYIRPLTRSRFHAFTLPREREREGERARAHNLSLALSLSLPPPPLPQS